MKHIAIACICCIDIWTKSRMQMSNTVNIKIIFHSVARKSQENIGHCIMHDNHKNYKKIQESRILKMQVQ